MHTDDWATVTDLELRLDAVTQPREPVSMLSAALWYAEQELHVFPLQPRSKIPHKGTRGLKEATTDLDRIRKWWSRPWMFEANVAIATGHLIDVIDIDGPNGVQSWAKISEQAHTGPNPKCTQPDCICVGSGHILGTVSTPRYGKEPRSGGNHLYIAATGRGNKAAIFPGVDYRGANGYVLAPPSVMPDGTMYRWRRPLVLP